MKKEYRKHMQWWLDEFGAGDQVDRYVELFPELDSRLAKFAVGIYLWNAKGLIDINNPDDISKVRLILRVLDQTPGYDFFDNVFNEADPDTVCQIIGMSPVTPIEEGYIDFDYSVMEIKNFEDAHSYFEAVSWCIVISEESFKEYTGNGNRFYFCGNGDWWDTTCVPGMGFPHDTYGYSLICDMPTKDEEIISNIPVTDTTLGFESDTECDFDPYDLITYNADKSENARYQYGDHAPGEEKYQEACRFKPSDKVLCLMYEGYDAVFPGIVVGPLTEQYLRKLYETNEDMRIGYSSADEAVEQWTGWNWDSVIVRPLVRLKNDWEEMGDTVMVNRVYVFPYKKF